MTRDSNGNRGGKLQRDYWRTYVETLILEPLWSTTIRQVFDSAARTASRLNESSINDPIAFVIDAYRATEYAHRPLTRAAFDEMVSSGNLGLIPADVRNAGLIRYFRSDDTSLATRTAVLNSPYRARVRRLLSFDIQAAMRERCSDLYNATGEIIGFEDNCDLGLSADKIQSAAAALRSGHRITERLATSFLYSLFADSCFSGRSRESGEFDSSTGDCTFIGSSW